MEHPAADGHFWSHGPDAGPQDFDTGAVESAGGYFFPPEPPPWNEPAARQAPPFPGEILPEQAQYPAAETPSVWQPPPAPRQHVQPVEVPDLPPPAAGFPPLPPQQPSSPASHVWVKIPARPAGTEPPSPPPPPSTRLAPMPTLDIREAREAVPPAWSPPPREPAPRPPAPTPWPQAQQEEPAPAQPPPATLQVLVNKGGRTDLRERDGAFQVRGWDERLEGINSGVNPLAENFRTLRTRILHPVAGPPPRSLLITSASPAEGKSFVCANLGISVAQGVEQYALMVDCDLRRPALGQLFGLPNERGLVDHLANGEDLASLILKTGVYKLSLIPGGTPPDNPSELLDSERMVALVDELVARYQDRLILLDSPPLQAASETAVLARHVDGVVLVARWGAGRKEHIKALVETIGREKIVGLVFNGVRTTTLDTKLFGYTDYQSSYYRK